MEMEHGELKIDINIKKILLPASAVLCAVSVTVMIFALTLGNRKGFTPPPFDSTAVQGTPEVSDNLGWLPVEASDIFTAFLCGKITSVGQTADIYFTSSQTNTVWIKLRILDSHGDIIGETGLIKPGEYVKSVTFTDIPSDGSEIKLKIMAYEPDTYFSAGSASLNTTIKIGG